MKERWIRSPSWPRYEISSFGRVRLCVRTRTSKPGTILAARPRSGYPCVTLFRDDNSRRTMAVHWLVCEAFHGIPPAGTQAAHRDGSRTNNVSSNLYWATAKENMSDRDAHGRTARGERNTKSVISTSTAKTIKRLLADGLGTTKTANTLGLNRSIVVHIAYGRTWRHIA